MDFRLKIKALRLSTPLCQQTLFKVNYKSFGIDSEMKIVVIMCTQNKKQITIINDKLFSIFFLLS